MTRTKRCCSPRVHPTEKKNLLSINIIFVIKPLPVTEPSTNIPTPTLFLVNKPIRPLSVTKPVKIILFSTLLIA
ncbi:hypothetical protein HanPI659440_Chr15g0607401 [Helianthus annuus]|nr:hypothetical protein HanPI659440_Chr15g0607401 [Helianthus annuus]